MDASPQGERWANPTAAARRATALGLQAQDALARGRSLLADCKSVHTRCRLTQLAAIQLRHASRCRRREYVGPVFVEGHSEQSAGWVLVVDDNEAVRETTAEVLATAGFNVKTAQGEEAVQLLAEGDIRVLLLDVGLEHQGLAVLDRVAAFPPVILMSGDARDPEDPRVSAFLPKPIPVHRLIEEVARLASEPQ